MTSTPSDTTYEARRCDATFDVSYDRFVSAFESLLGRFDVGTLTTIASESPEAARERLALFVGPLDFTLFQKLDHGGLLTALIQRPTRATTYVFGNALIAIELTQHDARVGLYVPLRLFVQAIANGRVQVTYDLPSATMAQFKSPEIDRVARSLDEKVARLLETTVNEASPSARAGI